MIFKLFKNRNFNLRSKSNFAAWLLIKSIFWKLFVWCRFLISGRHCSREAIWPFSQYKFECQKYAIGSFHVRSMPLCPCIEKHTKKHTEYCSSSKTLWAPFLSWNPKSLPEPNMHMVSLFLLWEIIRKWFFLL